MKILVIKTSSMGDVIHTLPAISDVSFAMPDCKIDWVVEESFAEIPHWHPAVTQVIPVALRRWRKNPWHAWRSGQWQAFKSQLRENNYDVVIDAQGLMKSAFLTRQARGLRCGLDQFSARESLASIIYQKKIPVAKEQHAVSRVRQLFADALRYVPARIEPHYGIDVTRLGKVDIDSKPYLLLLHGTTWATKHYPANYWRELARLATDAGYRLKLAWGNEAEKQRALRIAQVSHDVAVLPKMGLAQLAWVLAHAHGVIAVDTGLGHLAAALEVPTISLYGPTDARLTGTMGINQKHLSARFDCAPCLLKKCSYKQPTTEKPACFTTLPPKQVWDIATAYFQACQSMLHE